MSPQAGKGWNKIRRSVALIVLSLILFLPMPGLAESRNVVRIEGGTLRGTPLAENIRFFGSVPYAAPPVGNLRWRPPQPVIPWGDVERDASTLPPECPQIPVSPDGLFAPSAAKQDEDCLFLNVWTGAAGPGERRPVMLWLHGGGFMQGSSAVPMYDGAAMARRGIVFVSMNYRLGVLGFLAHPALSAESSRHVSGNYGTLDQIAALHWLQRNIAAFGGDPNNVTVIGQSAGSMSLNLLTASPLATGLFHKGIGETGAVMGMLSSRPLSHAEDKGTDFASRMGAVSAADLRSLDANRLVEAAGIVPGTFEPIADGWALPSSAVEVYRNRRQNDVPLLIGSNADENPRDPAISAASYRAMLDTIFGIEAKGLISLFPAKSDEQARQSARALMTQAMAQFPMHIWARWQTRTGTAPLYLYRFTQVPPVPRGRYLEQRATTQMGAWHGAEIVYALDNLSTRDWRWTRHDRLLSNTLASYWTNFARTGDPNGAGLPAWPQYRENPAQVMELGKRIGPIPEPNAATFEILDRLYDAER